MKWMLACAALVATVQPGLAGERARSPADATVFVRVIGSLHAEIDELGQRRTLDQDQIELASGSGFVISPSGYVLTNAHVINLAGSDANDGIRKTSVTMKLSRIEVCFPPEAVEARSVAAPCSEASVYASDPQLDLAVLFVNASNLPYLGLGDSDVATPGQAVQALGFPFGRALDIGRGAGADIAPAMSTTVGTISALRTGDLGERRYLQINANVNPGNSGGPVIDRDGFAIGVIHARINEAVGIGLAIPINQVKEFLESHGLESVLPVRRLRLGAAQRFESKAIALRMPEGFSDVSPFRSRVETEAHPMDVSLRVDRVLSPWPLKQIEQQLVAMQAFEAITTLSSEGRIVSQPGGPAAILGHATGTVIGTGTGIGTGASGSDTEVRMVYAVLDLGREKLVARFVGPSEQVAFNEGVLRDALASLEGQRLLVGESGPAEMPEWAVAPEATGQRRGVPVPVGWIVEPGAPSSCSGLPTASATGSTVPVRDFTVALRVAVWSAGAPGAAPVPDDAAATCSPRRGSLGRASYASREDWLGVSYAVEGVFVRVGQEVVQVEVRSPGERSAFARGVLAAWVKRAVE